MCIRDRVYIDDTVCHIYMDCQTAKFRDTKPRFQKNNHFIIILAVRLVLFHKGKHFFFLLWRENNFRL